MRLSKDVPHARFWFAVALAKNGGRAPPETLFLECERWFDARAVAIRLFGSPAARVVCLEKADLRRMPKRVQVRWVGNAVGAPTLRMQTRQVGARGKTGPWVDL